MSREEKLAFTLDFSKVKERITPGKEFRFIRVEGEFGFEEIRPHLSRGHKHVAKSLNLFKGRSPDGKYIVSDGGRMIAFADHVELAPDWTGSTQVEKMLGFNYQQKNAEEAYDRIQLAVRKETAQKLATLLHMPVTMKYQSVVLHSPVEEFTFTPR